MTSEPSARPIELSEPPAHEALRLWFEADKSRTYAGMARVLNMNPATVATWCRTDGPSRPSDIATLFAIMIMTGIPLHAWLSAEESAWLRALSNGVFVLLFERPKRPQMSDPRQMNFNGFEPNAPQLTAAAADIDTWT